MNRQINPTIQLDKSNKSKQIGLHEEWFQWAIGWNKTDENK